MAVRTPLYLDGSNQLREMSSTMIANIKSRCVYLYGADPSVDITVVGSGGNISPAMSDTRLVAGAESTSTGNEDGTRTSADYPSSATTQDAYTITAATYDRISQSIESVSQAADTSNIRNFVYQSSGNIYAMTHTDMYDTFYNDAIDTLVDGTDRDGTYRIHNATSLTGFTLVSATPVFTDTRANTGAYTAAGIPETQDQPTTINNYYVFRTNQGSAPSYTTPIYIRSDNNIQHHSTSSADAILTADMRYWGAQKIRYSVNGTGNNRGTGMSNTILNGTNYQTRLDLQGAGDGDDIYRAQEFPSGSVTTPSTWYLRIYRV